ncbi:MAG: hypothetical protein HFF11_03995 [Angelakisella sp.]|jgi:hypothetical protein|nr:hypothetical protein [Angelakisella sp.]
MNRKIISLLAALLVCLNLFPVRALAAEEMLSVGASHVIDTGTPPEELPELGAGLCEHHPSHTEDCGYTATEENKEGAPCTFDCVICRIQTLIDALPEEVTEETREMVRAQLDDILARFGELTEEEQAQVDLTRCLTLQTALDAANDPDPIPEGPLTAPLDFTNVGDGEGQTPAQGPGYRWSGDRESGYLLELDHFQMTLEENTVSSGDTPRAVTFPNKGHTIIRVTGENTLDVPGWSAFGAKVSHHSTGPLVDEDSLSIEGVGDSAALVIENSENVIRSTDTLEIRNLKIQANSTRYGIASYHRGVILENVNYQNQNTGKSAACIYSPDGDIKIENCQLNLQCTEDMGIYTRDGDLTVLDSEIDVSSGYSAGIAVARSSGENSYTAAFSGNTRVSSVCTSMYGIYVQGKLMVSSPAEISATGTSAALCIFNGITLEGEAVTDPQDGIITPPYGDSNIYTVRVGDIAARTVEIKQVQLLIEPERPVCNYGETTEVTITSQPPLAVPVTVYLEDEAVGSGNLGSSITIDSSKLEPGSQTLTAKLRENTGIVSKEFPLFVRATPTVSVPPTATLPYGEALSGAVLKGGTVIDPFSKKTVAGTWSWKDGTILPTMDNNGYTAVFTPADTASYNAVEEAIKPIVTPKPLTVNGVTAKDRAYDGTNRVQITAVSLNGTVGGDDVTVDTTGLNGTVSGSDVGRYTSVALPATLSLTGSAAKNYTLTQPVAAVSADVTIFKAPALTPRLGDLAVANGQAHTYAYGLGALRPEIPAGMSLGSTAVTYEMGSINLGSYYTGGAVIDGQTLTLPIQQVDSKDVKEIGTVTILIHTGNYEDMAATLHVRSVNKILPEGAPNLSVVSITYGQRIGEITLSGVMRDTANDREVPGTFVWSNPDNRPAVQEKYAAAWTFTPEDNNTYAIVTGTALIQVLPAPITNAMIELEPASFRYDGAVHSPEIVNVKLGNTLLTLGVDYTADIPQKSEAGSYTVTITGKGNYTGTAFATFTVNPVKAEDVTLPDGSQVQLSVEDGLSSVPEGLQGTPFDTIPAIEKELRTKVTAALSGASDQICVYDIRLQYLENGVWKDVDPDDFPAGGVTATLPYPDGTNGTGYTFTVQHMISKGPNAGTVETLAYTAVSEGLQCRFTSLSPVAVGYRAIEKQPSGDGGSGSYDRDDGYDFWQGVRQKIEAAKAGDTVRANAGSYDKMPWTVMEALKKSDHITLVIRWSGGADIVIPSEKALDEALRIYYPLAYLAGYDFGIITDPGKQNPETGGIWEIDAPITAQAPLTSAGTPEITDARRGLAETPELAGQGVEKAIPGVYEPTANATPAESPVQSGERGFFSVMAVFLLAALLGLFWTWRKKGNESHEE